MALATPEKQGRERALVLVKALPHDSKVGETVCCAGVTEKREWRRQFPIRFRHLKEKKFSRWQWIEYQWRTPGTDKRSESRRVQEDSIIPGDVLPLNKRAEFLDPLVVGSVEVAVQRGQSLALIRPRDVRFVCRKKTVEEIETERASFAAAASQKTFFDKDLTALDPCPYDFRFRYKTDAGSHDHSCADWETAVMFWNFEKRYGEDEALRLMSGTFNDEYPRKGMVFAMGTHSRWPQSWLLIGVIRLDVPKQMAFL
ncbi:conserved hypothetical protein [Magnetospirillum sp. LM-5]|uniref:hypothetical protein n=1 Tax=Magnetospirillum sp. LM-5 TaxID=2681466 RepID=UPI001382899E|nr:hypothetical protein [Magnetospirillum sp. LM-5]CAA7624736.1 conserved hypothetical protein [Magnetospirillum sp. LM-5]